MPKELVYSRDTLAGGEAAQAAVIEHVAVGWSKDKDVQLGVVPGPRIEILVDGEPLDDGLSGLWMDLDRRQINRLIHNLRRARTAAYGRDE